MRLDPNDMSQEVEDRRGSGGMLGGGGGRIGVGSIILAAVAYFVFGISPSTTITAVNAINGGSAPSAPAKQGVPSNDQQAVFASNILRSTEQVWGEIFAQHQTTYRKPKLVLYSGQTQTACGTGSAAAGPFYCPGDQKVYLDLRFFQEMERKMGAGGDFAHAYVIAHEVGHHIQFLTGTERKVAQMRRQASESEANQLSVRMELQADCYAGVWAAKANASKGILQQGDIEEGMNAATKIGDDYLQKRHQGMVVPDSFTHGSSEQRVRWFQKGLQSADVNTCNSFNTNAL